MFLQSSCVNYRLSLELTPPPLFPQAHSIWVTYDLGNYHPNLWHVLSYLPISQIDHICPCHYHVNVEVKCFTIYCLSGQFKAFLSTISLSISFIITVVYFITEERLRQLGNSCIRGRWRMPLTRIFHDKAFWHLQLLLRWSLANIILLQIIQGNISREIWTCTISWCLSTSETESDNTRWFSAIIKVIKGPWLGISGSILN